MNSFPKTILALFVACACAIGVICLGANRLIRGQSQTDMNSQRPNPDAEIDEKASRARGGDENAVRELADAVFRALPIGEVPDVIARPYKERVIRSEINYRNGRRQGIAEANIVRLIDELAARFDAPDYARTSPDEVRMLRLTFAEIMPHFIPRQPFQGANAVEERAVFSVAPQMSPLEAVYITSHLLWQKQHSAYALFTQAERAEIETALQRLQNTGFELTSEERADVRIALIEQRIYTDRLQLTPEEIAARVKQRSREQATPQLGARLIGRSSTPRQEEMRAVFRRASSMGIRDALDLAHQMLDALDIERQ